MTAGIIDAVRVNFTQSGGAFQLGAATDASVRTAVGIVNGTQVYYVATGIDASGNEIEREVGEGVISSSGTVITPSSRSWSTSGVGVGHTFTAPTKHLSLGVTRSMLDALIDNSNPVAPSAPAAFPAWGIPELSLPSNVTTFAAVADTAYGQFFTAIDSFALTSILTASTGTGTGGDSARFLLYSATRDGVTREYACSGAPIYDSGSVGFTAATTSVTLSLPTLVRGAHYYAAVVINHSRTLHMIGVLRFGQLFWRTDNNIRNNQGRWSHAQTFGGAATSSPVPVAINQNTTSPYFFPLGMRW